MPFGPEPKEDCVSVDARYPIGTLKLEEIRVDSEEIAGWIETVAAAPAALRAAVRDLGDEQLETRYREGGWTLRQVAHHVPDSHLNAYVRFRLALTEDEPTVRGYEEDRWAELPDARTAPVEVSLALLEAVHERWVRLLRAMSPSDFERGFQHSGRRLSLGRTLALYAWHGRHHTAQITTTRQRLGWR
jgi:uncharacterized damage-inducible protein DinB